MVDSLSNLGSTQAIEAVRRAQNEVRGRENGSDRPESSKPTDTVEISQEALNLSQAEETARNVRAELEANPDVTLGLDPNFDAEV